MTAVDTLTLMAIVLGEPEANSCIASLAPEDNILISAGTMAEALIVSARRKISEEISSPIDGLGLEIVTLTPAAARRIRHAYERWGKGLHPAGLNFGDCFAYEVAKEHSCRLIYVGNDFSKTDVESVL